MRVLIIDDHPLYREGLKALLMGLEPSVETADAGTIAQAMRAAPKGSAFASSSRRRSGSQTRTSQRPVDA